MSSHAVFPVILDFSLREKEQPMKLFLKCEGNRAEYNDYFSKTLGAILPLPKGEGRGEGERGKY